MLAAIAAAAVAISVVLAIAWDRSVEDRLARWSTEEVARRSGGTYRLALGDLSLRVFSGTLAFDSATIVTDTAKNRGRARPLPALSGRAVGCRLAGVNVLRLAFRRSLDAREFACERAAVRVALPEVLKSKDSASPAEKVGRPLGLRSVRIASVALPALNLTLVRPGRHGGTSVLLNHARFQAKDLTFDPTAEPRDQRTPWADYARLSATGVVVRRDTLTRIAAAGLEASLTDSTLRLAGASYEPRIPESEWVQRMGSRLDRVRFAVDSIHARGVAYRRYISTGDIAVRAVELDRPRLDVLTDKRMRPRPPERKRSPQQVAAAARRALRLDTVLVDRGTIVYREREPGRPKPGWVSFDSVRAAVLHLRLPADGDPVKIGARARLMNQGLLTFQASVPLGAPDFRYELSGRLGRMEAESFNRFLSQNEKFEFDSGRIDLITYRQIAKAGLVTTVVTPRYRDLSVERSGEAKEPLGALKRAAEELIADALVVRSHNSEEEGDDLRTVRTVHRVDPTVGWLQVIWRGLRESLTKAIKE